MYVANSDWFFNFFDCLLMSSTEVRGNFSGLAFVIYIPRAADPLNLEHWLAEEGAKDNPLSHSAIYVIVYTPRDISLSSSPASLFLFMFCDFYQQLLLLQANTGRISTRKQ